MKEQLVICASQYPELLKSLHIPVKIAFFILFYSNQQNLSEKQIK